MDKITAQVAVEAIVANPAAFDRDTVEAVRRTATEVGVAAFYLDMLPTPANAGAWWE